MTPRKKCIVFNLPEYRHDEFTEGLDGVSAEYFHSADIAIHITEQGDIYFIHDNAPIDFSDAFVYIRLRGKEGHMCGMIHTYLEHNKIPSVDRINGSFKQKGGKITQMLMLALAGIRIPQTLIFSPIAYQKNHAYITRAMGTPLICKNDGRRGEKVFLMQQENDLETHVHSIAPYKLTLIQPFIPNEFDTRTLVVCNSILGAIKRTRTHGFLNNISQGAIATAYTPSEEESLTALAAAHACGIDVGGVDMIQTTHGPVVLEVNKAPQVEGFEQIHGERVFARIARILKDAHADT